MDYDPRDDARKSYELAIEEKRKKLESFPCVRIGDATLYQGDALQILPLLPRVNVMLMDPPYEASLHASKNSLRGRVRVDSGPDLRGLDFAPIDGIRSEVVRLGTLGCAEWFMAFCTAEGVAKWADEINASAMKYKRACVWVKPDSTPQLNGQGPAQGAEHFVCAWAGSGHARWNSGGKRGVYTHCVNGPKRHGVHPTEKPVSLIAEILLDFTTPGSIVSDPFMGSGTTGVACAKLGRRFIGIEIERRYFDIACQRIEEAYAQPDMFVEPPAKPEQTGFSWDKPT